MTDEARTEEDERIAQDRRIAEAMLHCTAIEDGEKLITYHSRPRVERAYAFMRRKLDAFGQIFELLDLEAGEPEPSEARASKA